MTTAQSVVLFAGIWIGGTVITAVMYGAFTVLMRWLETRHRDIFLRNLPQYLEEEEEL